MVGLAIPFVLAVVTGPVEPRPGPTEMPSRLDLQWNAPTTCPDARQIERWVTSQLGSASSRAGPVVRARATVSGARGTGYTLELRIEGTSRVHTLHGVDCETLARAAAFSLVLMLDPSLTGETDDPEPAPAVAPEPAPVPDRPRPGPHGLVRADGGLEYGLLPATMATTGLMLGLEGQRLRGALEGRFGVPRAHSLSGPRDVGATFLYGTVAVRGCGLPRAGVATIPLCAGLEAGALRARGFGLAPNRTTHRALVTAQLMAGVAVPLGRRFGLALTAAGLIPVLRPAVAVDGAGELHRLGAAGVRATLGISVRFPERRGRE